MYAKDFDSALATRSKNLDHTAFSYKMENAVAPYGLDSAMPKRLEFDESRMSLWIHYANGERRDGVGDRLDVAGIETDRHQENPIVLFDHGKVVFLPLGMAEDPLSGEYTNRIDPLTRAARLNCFFYQSEKQFPAFKHAGEGGISPYDHLLFSEQVYDMAIKRFIRAGSIGYSVIEATHLPPDYERGIPAGMHLRRVKMLEGSLVILPASQDTVSKMLCMGRCCGKPMSPYFIKSLQPYDQGRPAQLGWEPYMKNLRHKYRKDHCCASCKAGKPCTGNKGQPSDKISPDKAEQILEDGTANGQPLTPKQRGMFGAAASKDKYLKRLKALTGEAIRVSMIVECKGELGKVVHISDGSGSIAKGMVYVHFPSGARWVEHTKLKESSYKAMDIFHPGQDTYRSIEGTGTSKDRDASLWDEGGGEENIDSSPLSMTQRPTKGIRKVKAGDDEWLGGSWRGKPCGQGVSASRTGCIPQGGQQADQPQQVAPVQTPPPPAAAPAPAPAAASATPGSTEPPVTTSGHVRGGRNIVGVDYSFQPGGKAKTRRMILNRDGSVFAKPGDPVKVTQVDGHRVTVQNRAGQTYQGTDSVDFRKSLNPHTKAASGPWTVTGSGTQWFVVDTRASGAKPIGPFRTREDAQKEADKLNNRSGPPKGSKVMTQRKSLRDPTGRERASLSPSTLANSTEGTELPTEKYKDLKAIRTKYRQAKTCMRRLRKSRAGSAVIRVRSKDVDALRKTAQEKGVSLKWLSSDKGIDRVKLSGDDTAIEHVSKMHGRLK